MLEKQKEFARSHVLLTAANHFAAGFGIALILQHYLAGNPFLPVVIGWILVAFAAVVHAYEWTR